jgi:type IV pilus assembly protein PilX
MNDCRCERQRGSALIISLVFLLLLTILGMGAMQSSTLQERMAGNTRDYNVAFQAAEAGLRAGEAELSAATAIPAYDGSSAGHILPLTDVNTGNGGFWESYDWLGAASLTTGSKQVGSDLLLNSANNPRYVIEQFPVAPCEEDVTSDFSAGKAGQRAAASASNCQIYRVTTRASSNTGDSVIILQSMYKRRVAGS